jgi:hypothetical protein
VPLAYDRTQAYDAKLAALGQQANSSCFTENGGRYVLRSASSPIKQQVLFALVRRQIIGTMLSRLLLADGWRCQFALFDGRGRPLVPLGLEVGEIMDRLMEDRKAPRTNSQSTSASRGKIAPTSWCCAANKYGPGLDGPVARSGMLWGLGAHSGRRCNSRPGCGRVDPWHLRTTCGLI